MPPIVLSEQLRNKKSKERWILGRSPKPPPTPGGRPPKKEPPPPRPPPNSGGGGIGDDPNTEKITFLVEEPLLCYKMISINTVSSRALVFILQLNLTRMCFHTNKYKMVVTPQLLFYILILLTFYLNIFLNQFTRHYINGHFVLLFAHYDWKSLILVN